MPDNELATEIETSTAELAEFIAHLPETEFQTDYLGQAGETVASVIELLTTSLEYAYAWLTAVTGAVAPAPVPGNGHRARRQAGRAFDKAGTIARLRTSQTGASNLIRTLRRGQLEAAAPSVPGLDVGNVTLGQAISLLIEQQRRSIILMKESVTPAGRPQAAPAGDAGRAAEGLPGGPARAYETRPGARFADEGPVEAPPPVPDGWSIAPPDFVGVGAQRSGSTWWYSVIATHPDVETVPDRGKEIHFFDNCRGVTDVPPESYHRYFPRAPGRLCGEWTPRYMYDYWTPSVLHAVAPQTKVLAILRDPVDRFISGLALNMEYGFSINPMLLHHNFAQGLYWSQLRGLLAHFPSSQVLVLQYERCVADPVSQALRTFQFLGLDPYTWKMPPDMSRRVNPTRNQKPAVNAATVAAMRLAYRAELRKLFADFPEIDGTLWRTAT